MKAQQLLLEANQAEKCLWLLGSIPLFDNVCYSEPENTGFLINDYLERQSNLDLVHQEARTSESNIVTGNRTNLLFIETSL